MWNQINQPTNEKSNTVLVHKLRQNYLIFNVMLLQKNSWV